jgi:hypothetical protein
LILKDLIAIINHVKNGDKKIWIPGFKEKSRKDY